MTAAANSQGASTMHLYAIAILFKRSDGAVDVFKIGHDLSTFGYFQRSSVREFLNFSCKVVVERTKICSRAAVEEKEYVCHVCVRADGLSGVVVSDRTYPDRVAQTLVSRILDEFTAQYPENTWANLTHLGTALTFPQLEQYLKKYQNPKEADAMMKIQDQLDETKVVLHKTIETLLERGEKLDDLVARSNDLSAQSKTFYTTAKKMNSCGC